MKNYFEYNDGKNIIPKGAFRISASQISNYFDTTSKWYREHLLGEDGFQGSTASELGNVIHAAMAMYLDTKTIDKQQLIDYINNINNPEVDKTTILEQYEIMINTLINNFLLENLGTYSEEFIWQQIHPNIGVGGSYDMYDDGYNYYCTDEALKHL